MSCPHMHTQNNEDGTGETVDANGLATKGNWQSGERVDVSSAAGGTAANAMAPSTEIDTAIGTGVLSNHSWKVGLVF